jgi:hypothetical protein
LSFASSIMCAPETGSRSGGVEGRGVRHRAVVTELGRARLTSCVPLDWVIKESSPGPGVSLDL